MDTARLHRSWLRQFITIAALLGAVLSTPQLTAATYLPGKIVRADLLTTDLNAAANFYNKVFGWRLQRHDAEGYIDAFIRGEPVATFASYSDSKAPADGSIWLPSISVTDVDAAVRAVKRNGGKVLEAAQHVPGIGRAAVIEDPNGAVVMMLRNDNGDPADGPAAHNEWLWPELWTDRPDATAQFYDKVVGYKAVTHRGQKGHDYRILGRDGVARATILRTPIPDVESNWLLYMKVRDVHRTARAVVENGGRVLIPPMKGDLNDDIAIVADPTGGVFAIQAGGD
ncbi:hypothetical protein SAMN04487965_2553 [Microbulbifer donghaiensis]|uniref:VOC domain-containing protein n=1 Tax=Microbulbifer donghaiensis TaxID=494016 RepID=A0A1M5E0X8_9GAMM|nr:VOC family protein [Microbulbifer donghaiensis]SHF72711.1 hypothetical protein SAMN04487965_2553 [Microbulbifer donghaiensis]